MAGLRGFLVAMNQEGEYVPRLANLHKPLYDQLCKSVSWYQGHAQEKAYADIKNVLISTKVLAPYDPKLETTLA